MAPSIILVIMIIGMASLFSQWIAWSLKLPSILFLLVCGILLGPVFHVLNADHLLGHLLFPLIHISVAIILFEGSLSLKLVEIKGQQSVVRNLVTIGLLTTAIMIAVCAHYLFQLPWGVAMLFGVLASIGGPTVVAPILRSIRPTKKVETILRWEGLLIDPIGAILAVLMVSFLEAYSSASALNHVWIIFIQMLISGLFLGSGVGFALGILIRGHWMPEYLRNLTSLVLVISVYVLSNWLVEGSGLLAVTIMGVFLANMRDVHIDDILDFKENLSILLISGIFILLASRIDLSALKHLGLGVILLLIAIQFIIRPLAVLLSTVGSSLNLKEKLLISWIAPRGIVAAAVAAIYSVKLQAQGGENQHILVTLVFSVIICTVIWQSFTARLLAKVLNLSEPEPHGFMIIGANIVARELGKALQEEGLKVILASSHWEQTRLAKMDGLACYYGNPISEHADRHLDLVGIGKVLTVTNNTQHNVLANLRYQHEFGKKAIFHLLTTYEVKHPEKHQIAAKHSGQTLFDSTLNFEHLIKLMNDGAVIKRTQLSESFTFEQFKASLVKNAVLLFAISPRGRVVVFERQEQNVNAGKDWVVLSLIPQEI